MKPYSENKKLKIIEMVAGPGAGKSATSYFLAGHMKARGYKVEYVPEFAKSMIWDSRNQSNGMIFTEQDFMLAMQNNMFRRLLDHDIEYVVTDTSLLLGLIYTSSWYPKSFEPFLMEVYNSYKNITFFVDRGDIPYIEDGRNEDEKQAIQKDRDALTLLKDQNIPFYTVIQSTSQVDRASLEMLSTIEMRRTSGIDK
jgi:nicotinamide riboside kinase